VEQVFQSTESAAQGAASDLIQLVTFTIGDEEFGVDILKVREINRMMDITRVPKSPHYVEGVVNLRGKVIPVIDLRKRFDMEPRESDKETRIVVVEVDSKTIGFIVDSVSEVLRIPADTVEPPPPFVADVDAEYISGVGKLDDRLLILLDLEKLFRQDARMTPEA
jgi:purine-binding chemotaxis protein CheW